MKVSVVVPVYNVEEKLHICVDSVLAQTFTDFELILVDDGSTDNCGKICDEYALKDSRIHVIHKENGGLSSARNAGIDWCFENSDSEWITFVDSDDWIHPDYLKCLFNAVALGQVDLAVSPIKKVYNIENFESVSYNYLIKDSTNVFKSYSKRMTDVSACGKLYKKELLKNIRFPVGKLWEDLFTTYKVFLLTHNCVEISDSIYFYYINDCGIIRRNWRPKRLDELEAYETMLAFFKNKKYQELYVAYQEPYIRAMSYSYDMCIHSDMSEEEIKKYSKLLSKKMRSALRMYKRNTSICFKKDKGVYETAHPHLMQMYYIMCSVKNRIIKRK